MSGNLIEDERAVIEALIGKFTTASIIQQLWKGTLKKNIFYLFVFLYLLLLIFLRQKLILSNQDQDLARFIASKRRMALLSF